MNMTRAAKELTQTRLWDKCGYPVGNVLRDEPGNPVGVVVPREFAAKVKEILDECKYNSRVSVISVSDEARTQIHRALDELVRELDYEFRRIA